MQIRASLKFEKLALEDDKLLVIELLGDLGLFLLGCTYRARTQLRMDPCVMQMPQAQKLNSFE